MNILNYKNQLILPEFLQALIKKESFHFEFSNLSIHIRTKYCPQPNKPYELIIGIAPYKSGIIHNELEDNSGSIPDAWLCGSNFNLLFEFKIRGTLDDGQISAHKRLIGKENIEVIRLTWDQVFDSLASVEINDAEVLKYLIHNFLNLKSKFQSKRRSSGMLKAIISNINKIHELHFVITGSRAYTPYTLDMVYGSNRVPLKDDLPGITAARKYIPQYLYNNKDSLPLDFKGDLTEISDYCVGPVRADN